MIGTRMRHSARRPAVRRGAVLAAALLAVLAVGRAHGDETRVLKIATLAPEGSSWMKIMREWATNVQRRAPGLQIKFFAGGVAGDERDAVRKMRLGQINGAAVTAIGLGLIQPEIRVFELFFEFNSTEEMDRVRLALDSEIRKKFEEKGYVLLNWGDVGPVHLFSNVEVRSRADLPVMKMWQWADDPLVRALFQQLGLKGVNLGVPDVLPSLQTGLIDACYGSPLSTLALSWNTKVKYMTQMEMSQSIGAQVLTRAAWDGLPPATRQIILEETKKLDEKMRRVVRDQDNVRSLEKMKSLGLKVVPTPPQLVAEFEKEARIVAAQLDGKVYSAAWRAHVEKVRDEMRAGRK